MEVFLRVLFFMSLKSSQLPGLYIEQTRAEKALLTRTQNPITSQNQGDSSALGKEDIPECILGYGQVDDV